MVADDGNRNKDNPWLSPNIPYQEKDDVKLWGIFLFGMIGATATTFALSRSQAARKGASGSSFRSSFLEEAWKRYNRRMREEYEEEMERVERIRRMQRERNKYKKSYESWRQNNNGYGAYHHHFQRDDWYWKADTSYRDHRTNFGPPPRDGGSFSLSHQY